MVAPSPPLLPVSVFPAAAATTTIVLLAPDTASSAADPCAYLTCLLDSAKRSLSGARPWAELLDRAALSRPDSLAATTGAKLTVIIYIHGGDFVAESAKSPNYHRFLNNLACACPALGVSVDYRLAPEHPLPAAYEDSLAALGWVLSTADPWIVAHDDLGRVFVAGDSISNNICHHVAIQPDVAHLKGSVLIHPWSWGSEAVVEETCDPTGHAHGAGLGMFGTSGADNPRINPMAPDAPGLESLACKRVMVCTVKGDFLRWRGRTYSEAVTAARGTGEQEVELLETEGRGTSSTSSPKQEVELSSPTPPRRPPPPSSASSTPPPPPSLTGMCSWLLVY